jgi:hypothetical protein
MKKNRVVLAAGAIALAGFVLGAWVYRSDPARAQDAPFRQCVLGRQETVDIDDQGRVAVLERDRMIQVPRGWVPVGGGGTGGMGVVLFCRR